MCVLFCFARLMDGVERALATFAMLVPIIIGLLMPLTEAKRAVRRLLLSLLIISPIQLALNGVRMPEDIPSFLAAMLVPFLLGVQAGFAFWAARCRFHHFRSEG